MRLRLLMDIYSNFGKMNRTQGVIFKFGLSKTEMLDTESRPTATFQFKCVLNCGTMTSFTEKLIVILIKLAVNYYDPTRQGTFSRVFR